MDVTITHKITASTSAVYITRSAAEGLCIKQFNVMT